MQLGRKDRNKPRATQTRAGSCRLAAAGCALALSAVLAAPSAEAAIVTKAAPDFTLPSSAGANLRLQEQRGQVVMINFWATWCGPCKVETPWIVELRDKYAAQGFEVLGVDTEGDDLQPGDKAGWAKAEANASKFAADEKIPYPVLLDGDSISREYGGLDDLPASFFVDRSGKVVVATVGLTSESDIEGNIKKALEE